MKHFRFQRRRGFSLIELLVVVATLAVLAGILLPAFGLVRQKMASSQSVSNLRELGSALLLFSNEHKGHFPPVAIQTKTEAGGWQNLGSWDGYLLKYLGVDVPPNGVRQNYDQVKPLEKLFSHPLDDSEITLEGGIRRGYSMPAGDGMIGKATWEGTGWFPSESNLKIGDPAKTFLLVEKPGYANNIVGRTGMAGIQVPEEQLTHQKDLNSSGAFNYLFADGHVETLLPEETVGRGDLSSPGGFWTLDTSD